MDKIEINKDTLEDWLNITIDDIVQNIIDEYNDTSNYSDFCFISFNHELSSINNLKKFNFIDDDILKQLLSSNNNKKLDNHSISKISELINQNNFNINQINKTFELIEIINYKFKSLKLELIKDNKRLKSFIVDNI